MEGLATGGSAQGRQTLTVRDGDPGAVHTLEQVAESTAAAVLLLQMQALLTDLERIPAAAAVSRDDLDQWHRAIAGSFSVARANFLQAVAAASSAMPPAMRTELQALDGRYARATQKLTAQGVAITRPGLAPIAPNAIAPRDSPPVCNLIARKGEPRSSPPAPCFDRFPSLESVLSREIKFPSAA